MNFAELKTEVLAAAFPLGVPENLRTSIESYVLSAIIEIQRAVRCFRYRHDNVYAACQTYWHCGASVITAPTGRILRAYTVENEGWCNPVVYNPVTLGEFRRWQARWQTMWRNAYYRDVVPNGTSALPMGFDVPNASSDATCGRAQAGVYALDATSRRLYVGPWLQTTESLVVEWQGIKRAFADGDLVPDDADFIRLCRLFVELEYGRKWGCNDLPVREFSWREALADISVTCEQETRLHGEPATAEEATAAEWNVYTPETVADSTESDSEYKFTFVGNVGDANPSPEALPDLVAADNPDGLVVLLGDSKNLSQGALTTLSYWSAWTSDDRLRAALGNVDMDDGVLGADVRTLVGNPGNGRYFTITRGPVSIFVINSGVNSSDELVEPDANYAGGKQYNEILAAIVRDTSIWKFAVLHHPPYTSGSDTYPGLTDVRWVSNLPVHAVLTAHPHNYERLFIRNRYHLNVGTGGGQLESFRENPYPGSQERVEELGYLRLTADCETATFEFVDLDGTVQDTLAFSDPGITNILADMPADPAITIHPASMVVAEESAALLSVTASGTTPFTYQWQLDGEDIVDANDSTYLIESVTTSGSYRVLVTGPNGAELSRAATVLVGSGTGAGGGGLVYFDTIAEMVADTRTDWAWALVLNYEPLDGNIGMWQMLPSDSILVPNGTDILQTAATRNVFRIFYREYIGPEESSDPEYVDYDVSTPTWFDSYTGLQASTVTTPLVITIDLNGALAFFEYTDGADETGTEGVDWVANANDVHYRRVV
jgi:hypothetical protein